jgi:hypothetical protein
MPMAERTLDPAVAITAHLRFIPYPGTVLTSARQVASRRKAARGGECGTGGHGRTDVGLHDTGCTWVHAAAVQDTAAAELGAYRCCDDRFATGPRPWVSDQSAPTGRRCMGT